MIKTALLFCSFFSLLMSHSQTFEWVNQIAGNNNDKPYGMHIDSQNNIYLCGTFNGSMDADPGAGVSNLNSQGGDDAFVAKYDNDGNLVWVKSVGGPSQQDRAYDVTVDEMGNVYFVGRFDQSCNFDPGLSDFSVVGNGQNDAFICKYNASGDFLWAKTFGGTGSDECRGVELKQNGNLVVTGMFSNTVDFDPGANTFNNTSNGSRDIFISEFSSQGDFVNTEHIGGVGNDIVHASSIDSSDNVSIVGYFADSIDFDPGPGVESLTNYVGSSSFLLSLDENGSFVSANQFYSDNYSEAYAVTTDKTGNRYVAGAMVGNTNFSPGVNDTIIPSNGDGSYITKIDLQGNLIWVKGFPDDEYHLPSSICLDSLNRVYITGEFTSDQDFDPDNGVAMMTSAGSTDAYILKLDQDGTFLWSRQFSGTNGVYGTEIQVDGNFNIISTGVFKNTVNFNLETGPVELASLGTWNVADIFLHKYSQCVPQYYVDSITTCDSYTWNDGFTYLNDTITPFLFLQDAFGCDSLVQLNLTLNQTPSNGINDNGGSFEATAIGANYQWINCTNNQPISGETNQTFTPTSSGDYAVIVENNGCIDTSICITYSDLSLKELDNELEVLVYPNPSHGQFNIDVDESFYPFEITITDMRGRVLLEESQFEPSQIELNETEGVYLLLIRGAGISITKRIVLH